MSEALEGCYPTVAGLIDDGHVGIKGKAGKSFGAQRRDDVGGLRVIVRFDMKRSLCGYFQQVLHRMEL